jgi:hypothetical protein
VLITANDRARALLEGKFKSEPRASDNVPFELPPPSIKNLPFQLVGMRKWNLMEYGFPSVPTRLSINPMTSQCSGAAGAVALAGEAALKTAVVNTVVGFGHAVDAAKVSL